MDQLRLSIFTVNSSLLYKITKLVNKQTILYNSKVFMTIEYILSKYSQRIIIHCHIH